jgi:cytochrome c-type biogenesis protein CcsB
MGQVEAVLFWVAIGFYLVASVAFQANFVFKKARWPNYAIISTCIAFVLHNAVIVTRWISTGHLPIIGDYENTLAGSWLIILIFLVLQIRFRNLRPLGAVVVPFSILMLGYGVLRSPELEPLTPAFQSNWLYVHIVFAWFAYSSYAIASGLAVLFLLKKRSEARGSNGVLSERLPSLGVLDELSYRFITFGFVADAVMLVAGSIWANSLWGHYWAWDPIETWSLISWIVYGIYLHLRVVHGWSQRRAAWLAVAGLSTVVISFFGINFIAEGLHVF